MKRLLHTAFALALLLAASCSRIPEVAVDYIRKPVAVGSGETIFSWQFDGEGEFVQDKCRIVIKGVWDSGEIHSPVPMLYLPEEIALKSLTTYRWKVEAWDRDGHRKVGGGRFRTAVFPAGNWTARWIGPVRPGVQQPFFRKEFTVGKGLRRATLCVASSGGRLVEIGGKPVEGAYSVATDLYRGIAGTYRVQDVTGLLSSGSNILTVQVVDEKAPALLAELHLDYKDGSHDIICTDGSWEVSLGSAYTLIPGGLQYDALVDSLSFGAAVPVEKVRSVLVPDESPLPSRERLVPREDLRTDSLRTFFFGGEIRANCIFEFSAGESGDVVELRYQDAAGKVVGTDAVVLGRKGRARWTDAFSSRTFQTLTVVCPKSTRVKVVSDILPPSPSTWAKMRGEVEGFVLDPMPFSAPFTRVDTLFSRYGDRKILEEAFPALESYLTFTRRKSLEEYTLMEKFANALGKDATPYADTRRIMTGK